ncbi:Uncharacterised protein [Serratia fonticola]|jgi:hypothetical protein|uniref:Uncharacterized protein n=1 Tax=Serratia fonticola TaxID=47917 RepID=A0A4U9TPT5_SERFO|nr:Uncharacterised protein [Serratia fonticola]CAI1800697.1 Uncharacterised protein [Serratia fonticola]VTR20262.1 Uncharacterised protein [Serratia fonticola]
MTLFFNNINEKTIKNGAFDSVISGRRLAAYFTRRI